MVIITILGIMSEAKLIPTAEAARRLGCSINTVQRRAKAGDLPYALKLDGLRGGFLFDAQVIEMVRRQQTSNQGEGPDATRSLAS